MKMEIHSLIYSCTHLTNTLRTPAYVPGTVLGAGNTEENKAEKFLMVWNLYSNGGVGHLTDKLSNCNKKNYSKGIEARGLISYFKHDDQKNGKGRWKGVQDGNERGRQADI